MALLQVEVNADLLSEMILDDLVNDVARDLGDARDDRVATNTALAMTDAPDLETVLQRLQQMEVRSVQAQATQLLHRLASDPPPHPLPDKFLCLKKTSNEVTLDFLFLNCAVHPVVTSLTVSC